MNAYSLERTRADAYSKDEVLEELRRVKEQCLGNSFSTRDFNRISKTCTYQAVFRIFGTWKRALAEVGVEYKRKFSSRQKITNIQLFNEMERVWKLLGHRPSRQEWIQQSPEYSYKAYSDRFGGWIAACGNFIAYKSGNLSPEQQGNEGLEKEYLLAKPSDTKKVVVGTRGIPLKLRFKIMDRDGYRCVLCGKSPAMDIGTKLHLDHIHPYSKGGKSEEMNLRTLCQNCNWGKGND